MEEIIGSILRPFDDYMAALEKVNDYAAAGRRVDCEH